MAKFKAKPERDAERDERITMEIVVDAHDSEERSMGWYYYLENQLEFPFAANCIAKRASSPLRINDKVEVIGMPGETECEREVFVTIHWNDEDLAVPLSQLMPTRLASESTTQAVEDWHYWVRMGFEF